MTEAKSQAPGVETNWLSRTHPTLRGSTAMTAERVWARRYRIHLLVTDAAIVVLSIVLALISRFGLANADFEEHAATHWVVASIIVTAWMLSLSLYGTRDLRVIGVGASEYRRVFTASVFTFGALAILFLIVKLDIARGFFMLALPVGLLGLLGTRWLWRRWLTGARARGHYLCRALVAGSCADVAYVVDQINHNGGATYHILGAATDEANAGQQQRYDCNVPIVADLSTIAVSAANLDVDTVIVAGNPASDTTFIRDLSWQLEGTATELILAARLTDVAGPRIHYRPVEGLPLIQVEIPRFEGGKHLLKRAFDVVGSAVALALFSPLLVVIAVMVRLDSSGAAIFSQERVGRDGRLFTIYKFRSMVTTAEKDQGPLADRNEGAGVLFKLKDDPRVTNVGRFLRRYSLDELPQLWNVLIGDMSLVGPRPPLPNEVRGYPEHVHRRLYIKPGLTGMWQVGGRSDLSWDESVRLDLYYVENWSLMGDLILIWRTFRVLLHPTGAY
jgi:exopolysaccharide biosynthesis polyprenyl glycosylphosphotransferase